MLTQSEDLLLQIEALRDDMAGYKIIRNWLIVAVVVSLSMFIGGIILGATHTIGGGWAAGIVVPGVLASPVAVGLLFAGVDGYEYRSQASKLRRLEAMHSAALNKEMGLR